MALNARQRKFVDAYVGGLSATQAAITAGYTAKNADVTGPRLLGNVGVAAEIAARQSKAAEVAGLTLQAHLDRLNELATKAAGAQQYGPAVNAEVHRGKAVGLYVEQQKVTHAGTVRVLIQREGKRLK